MFEHPTSAAAAAQHHHMNNSKAQPNPATANPKMSEVERIKQELLGYQREIELMQKQREYAKLMKQQKQQQMEQTSDKSQQQQQQQQCRTQAEGNLIL